MNKIDIIYIYKKYYMSYVFQKKKNTKWTISWGHNVDNVINKYKHNLTQCIIYMFLVEYDLDVEKIEDSYDIINSNTSKSIKVGKTTVKNLRTRMLSHARLIKDNIYVLYIAPIESEKCEKKLHKSLTSYLDKRGIYVDFVNSNKYKKYGKCCVLRELYPIYCLKMITNIFRDYEIKIASIIKKHNGIPEHILQSYDTMENDNSKMDYMEMDY